MRLLVSLIPVVFSLLAFLLSILVLFQGRTPSYLPDVYIAKIDTSRIGSDFDVIGESNNRFLDRIGDRIDDIAGGIANRFVDSVGIHDVYTAHIMNFCYGDAPSEDIRDNKTAGVDHCSKQVAGYGFELDRVLERDLEIGGRNITLEDLRWPSAIQDMDRNVRHLMKALFAFFVVGVAASGVSFILSIFGVPFGGPKVILINAIVAAISFLFLLIGAILTTAASLRLRNGVNKHLRPFGVRAYSSGTMMGMVWVAAIAMLITTLCFLFQMHRGRKSKVAEHGHEKNVGKSHYKRRRWYQR